jgi:uncharacterized protein
MHYHAGPMPVEAFELKVESGAVRGSLQMPENIRAGASVPAVLMCRGVFVFAEDAGGLFDDLSKALSESGLAVVRFEHRCADLILEDFDAHRAVDDLEDAMAIIRWLMRREDIDKSRIGLIGYSLGAIAATAITQSMPSIARVCLLSATTASNLASRLANGNGAHSFLQPGQVPASYASSLAGIDSAQEIARHQRPTMVLHGAADRFISVDVSLEYVKALADAGRRVNHVLVARADHTFSSRETRAACLELVTDFFRAMVAENQSTESVASST